MAVLGVCSSHGSQVSLREIGDGNIRRPLFPGECHPRNQAHPIGYEGCVRVHDHGPFSGLAVSVFCLPSPSESLCFIAMYVSQLASNASLCLPKAATTSVLHHALHHRAYCSSFGWVHPCYPTFRAQLRRCPPPCPLVSSVSTPCSLLRCPLYPLPCGFEGLGRAVPLCSVLWQPLDSLILLIGLCPWASPGPLWFVSGALVHLLLYLSSSSLRSQ